MAAEHYRYHAPEELIAQYPRERRSSGRLLYLPAKAGLQDRRFSELPVLLAAGDLLIVNDTAVAPARLFGAKPGGGKVEMLLERMHDSRRARVQIRASRAPRPGQELIFEGGARARVTGRRDSFFVLEFNCELHPHLMRHGHVPLPPYIRREDAPADREAYQTVFARHSGAVAAPTAGLHFDGDVLKALQRRGVAVAHVTLHVGAGTFKPVSAAQVRRAELHAEWMRVPAEVCRSIENCRRRGGRVCAVGTTVTRALETAALGGEPKPFEGETRLFIMPGFRFRVVDMLVTNFHLPGSSLLMLVCAYAGRERVLSAYEHAVRRRYRLFSYGDAMLLERAGGTA